MKKISIVTATRAEYGLLLPVIKELRKLENSEFHVDVIVTGTHLDEKYGMTIKEIEADSIRIDYKIIISIKSDTELDISSNQSETLVKFTKLFSRECYDAIIILGDRYETLAIAIAAGNTRTPIFHLCGGDTTEGAIDEWIRHAITKMSYLHFVTNEESRKRVIQLGENPKRVFNYGSTSIDNILYAANMKKEEVLQSVGLQECVYALCTYHPVTMEAEDVALQMNELINAIEMFPEIQFIITKSNADLGGAKINEFLDCAEEKHENIHVFPSLGVRRYLSLMRYAKFVIGNSSSGIIETPAFHIPTVNIGDRQRGRRQADSIINCGTGSYDICKAIRIALSDDYQEKCKTTRCLYGSGNAAVQIAKKVFETINGRIDLKKKFYDLEIDV